MELTKNIFFNTDKLVANSTVKISYSGKLFQEQAEEVFIHYGFGNNWDNLSDLNVCDSHCFQLLLFSDKNIFGVGEMELVRNVPYNPQNKFKGRVLTFTVKDFNNGLKYGK